MQVVHSLCWKKDVGVLFGDLRQYAQKTARMLGRVTVRGVEEAEWGVRDAVAVQVKHRVQS